MGIESVTRLRVDKERYNLSAVQSSLPGRASQPGGVPASPPSHTLIIYANIINLYKTIEIINCMPKKFGKEH